MKSKKTPADKKVSHFYKWLLKCGNIYLHQNDSMCRAFEIVRENNLTTTK